MLKPSINEVLNKIDNRYYLVTTVAKRSRELIDGSIPYVMTKTKEIKPVTIATQEVAEGKIHFRKLTDEEVEASKLEEVIEDAQIIEE